MATPTEEETLIAFVATDPITSKIDNTIRTHPVAEALRANPDFSESRPHLTIPEPLRERNLTAGTLAGPGKIVVPPYVFSERGGKTMISLMYLGGDVCGHQGIVHGGLLATLLDEGLARCCFPALPNKVGVTANLNIDYRAPAMANQYVALRAETVKVEGRKAWVEGRIETLPTDGTEPVVLVEAKALFIEPRQAAVSWKEILEIFDFFFSVANFFFRPFRVFTKWRDLGEISAFLGFLFLVPGCHGEMKFKEIEHLLYILYMRLWGGNMLFLLNRSNIRLSRTIIDYNL